MGPDGNVQDINYGVSVVQGVPNQKPSAAAQHSTRSPILVSGDRSHVAAPMVTSPIDSCSTSSFLYVSVFSFSVDLCVV
jgi:hypothetical protein